jgi:hypothetical protein
MSIIEMVKIGQKSKIEQKSGRFFKTRHLSEIGSIMAALPSCRCLTQPPAASGSKY